MENKKKKVLTLPSPKERVLAHRLDLIPTCRPAGLLQRQAGVPAGKAGYLLLQEKGNYTEVLSQGRDDLTVSRLGLCILWAIYIINTPFVQAIIAKLEKAQLFIKKTWEVEQQYAPRQELYKKAKERYLALTSPFGEGTYADALYSAHGKKWSVFMCKHNAYKKVWG